MNTGPGCSLLFRRPRDLVRFILCAVEASSKDAAYKLPGNDVNRTITERRDSKADGSQYSH